MSHAGRSIRTENRILMISCGKLGEQEFRKAIAKLLEQLKNDHQKHQYSKANPHGKMTVKQLAAKDKGLQALKSPIRISAHSTGSPGSMALTSLHSRSRAKSGTWCSSKRRTPTP